MAEWAIERPIRQLGPVEKALEQRGRCIIAIDGCSFDFGLQPGDQHLRDVTKFFQFFVDDFLPRGISDCVIGEGVDSIDDFLNTLRYNLENVVNMLCLNDGKGSR